MQDTYTASYFENREVWPSEMATYQKYLFRDLAVLLPKEAESVLDAGCGNGFFLDLLPNRLRKVGVDRSGEALKDVKHEKHQSDLSQLPFEDGAFSVVYCTDVLEHTSNQESLLKIVRELRRVARDRLIISVPYRENLDAGLLWCKKCGHSFHRNHHFWSFDSSFMTMIASAVGVTHSYAVLSGDFWGGFDADYTSLQARLGDLHETTSGIPCAHCGTGKSFVKKFSPEQDKWAERILEINREHSNNSFRHAVARTELIVVFDLGKKKAAHLELGSYLDREFKLISDWKPVQFDTDRINFSEGSFRKTTDIPLSGGCPIVVERPRQRLNEISEKQDLLFSFWGRFVPRPDLTIRLEGRAAADTEFRIAAYRPGVGYSLVWNGKSGDTFSISVPLSGALTSRYGHLFQIYVDKGVLDISEVHFNGVEQAKWQEIGGNDASYMVRSSAEGILEGLAIYRDFGIGIRV